MHLKWFIRKGIIYQPRSLSGWIIFTVTLLWLIYSFINIDSHSHSVSDTLRNFFFIVILTGIVYSIIGFLTEMKDQK